MRGTALVLAVVTAWGFPSGARAGVVVTSVSERCTMPETPNDGNVVGYDAGMSLRFGSHSYWFFGDTLRDRDGDWQIDNLLEGFSFGTHVGRTFDTAGGDCFTAFTFKEDGNGEATVAFPKAGNECVTWPAGAIGTSTGKLYSYFEGWGTCSGGTVSNPQGTGLVRFTDPPLDMNVVRVPGYIFDPGPPFWGHALAASNAGTCGTQHWAYVFGSMPDGDVLLSRVLDASIEDRTKYLFWNGTAWVANAGAAAPIFTSTLGTLNGLSVAFNEHLDRYVAIYSCAFATQICLSYTNNPGAHPSRLTQGWTTQSIYSCPPGAAYRCKQAYQHDEAASGDSIYVTSSRHTALGDAEHPEYRLELRRFRLTWVP